MQSINYQQQIGQITNFIRQVLKKSGFTKSIIAVSGGVDSATSLMLLVQAVGPTNTLAVMMPCDNQDIEDAKRVINMAKIPPENIFLINIKEVVDIIFENVKSQMSKLEQWNNGAMEQLRAGNIMARVRMTILYDLAKANKALVCGTENKSEHLLGYFTLHGDAASDFEPITHLYKTQVKQLAKCLGVPQSIIDKTPTAGLWPGQTDEQELGFSYAEADEIMTLIMDKKMSVSEVVKKGFKQETVEKVVQKVATNSFKQKLPYSF